MARSGKPDGQERSIHISTSAPDRAFTLQIGEKVELAESDPDRSPPALALPSEALIRLVYGRLDADHHPDVQADGVTVDELRGIFRGF